MNNVRSRLRSALAAAAFAALSAQTALAQLPPTATTVRTVLAVTSLPSVVDAPLFFKLSKIELAAGQTTKYSGPVGFLYVLSGALAVQTDSAQRSLQPDDAFLVTAGNTHSLDASELQPAQAPCACSIERTRSASRTAARGSERALSCAARHSGSQAGPL